MKHITTLKLRFLGAAQEVTGSKTLVTYKDMKYLVDCGLFQGDKELRKLNWEDIPHAASIDGVILTHAHIDHSGYLPRLVKQGFKGPIYCTAATAALVEVLLKDAAHLQEEDAEFANRKGYSSHRPAEPLFTLDDVTSTLRMIKRVERDAWLELGTGLSFRLLRSGHLLGSSFVQIAFNNGEQARLVTFSGDLGSERSQIIKGPVSVEETDYLVLEGTYGDKTHKVENKEKRLASVIKHVHARHGVLVIPSFAVGRTQELLYMINQLEDDGLIPHMPLYVDSPMALHATEIYAKYEDDLRSVLDGKRFHSSMDGSRFTPILTPQQSRALQAKDGPMIIISAAGMLTGGRILHHLKTRLPHRANAVLFVGFQAHGTKGRLLQNGLDRINIHHEEVMVNAEIESLDGFSAHADAGEIVDWVRQFRRLPGKVFLNHGERDPLKALGYRLRNEFQLTDIEIPNVGEEYVLD